VTLNAAGFAPAKVNLTLHVTGQRPDGYHLLDSLVVFADVGDTVTAQAADTLTLDITGPFAKGVPSNAGNLMMRAARLLDPKRGARLTLDKHLPHPAGIGGGSSDAAATLRMLSALWGCPLPTVSQALTLGADVPVCLTPRPQRMQGIGDHLTPTPPLPDCALLLVNPCINVPTPDVFRALVQRNGSPMPNLPGWINFADLATWLTNQRNDMQTAAIQIAPVIRDVLMQINVTPDCALARMSGSGATCFGLFADLASAQAAARQISTIRPEWWVRAACVL
jgi:4-diphosphocytidyl-2-C-methyl-D-erythritol kinase